MRISLGTPCIAPVYIRQICLALIQQVMLVLLAALILDMGETIRVTVPASIGFWVGLLVILIRRPMTPTSGDLLFIRWGCVLAIVSAVFACHSAGLIPFVR
jgi:hypothetical protein